MRPCWLIEGITILCRTGQFPNSHFVRTGLVGREEGGAAGAPERSCAGVQTGRRECDMIPGPLINKRNGSD